MQETLAAIGLDHAGGDFEERGLAGPVAADERKPVARHDRQVRALEGRRAAEGELDVAKEEQRRRHLRLVRPRGARVKAAG